MHENSRKDVPSPTRIIEKPAIKQNGKHVTLAAIELSPYIGPDLECKGYVYELVYEVFRNAGYNVTIQFYPAARARALVKGGYVDGLLPLYYDVSLEKDFLFSDEFPGGVLGFLRKNSSIVYGVDPAKDIERALRSLKKYRIGAIRDSVYFPEFDSADYLIKEFVSDDSQNIQKLYRDRLDLVIIDKYSAAQIMVDYYPHLIGKLSFMDPPLARRGFHVAFSRKNSNEIIKRDFDVSLQAYARQGKVKDLLYRHGLIEPEDKNKIRIATVDNPDMLIMKELSRIYEKRNPAVDLEWIVMDENVLRTRLLSDLALQDGRFDIITIGSYDAPIYAQKGWISLLEPLFYTNYDTQDIMKPVRDLISYNNKLYSLPFYAESSMTYYRKDIFEKAGIEMPANPTWAQLKEFAAQVHDPDNGFYGIVLRGKAGWGENMALISTMVNAYGGQWFDLKWRPQLDQPEWEAALNIYESMLKKSGPPNVPTYGFNECLQLFADGKCAIWVDATVAAGMLYNPDRSQVSDKVGFAAAPQAVTEKGASWLWAWTLAIPTSSKKKHVAKDFILWATSKEYIQYVGQKYGWVSIPPGTRESTYSIPEYKEAAPFSAFVYNAIQNANPLDSTLNVNPYVGIQYVLIPEFPALGTQVGNEISRILDGRSTIDKALESSQRILMIQMKESNYIQ